MSKIMINSSIPIEGEFSWSIEKSLNSHGGVDIVAIDGALTSKCGYLPEITQIENERYVLAGVNVYKESFGSEEDDMVYYFHAKTYGMRPDLQEVKTKP